jgi:hypothetical protein
MGSPDYETITVSRTMKNVSDSLAPFRPPTAPASDIELEKKEIIKGSSGPNFLFLQAVILTLALSALCYLFLPLEYAHPIALLLLSVGVAVGIFLWK